MCGDKHIPYLRDYKPGESWIGIIMKLSVMTYSMEAAGWDFSNGIVELCRFTRGQDIDGIDWCSVHGAEPAQVRKVMDDHGLQTVCYTQFADLNFADRQHRLPGLDAVKRILDTAGILGADKIMLPMGGKAGLSACESRHNCISGLAEATEIARGYGITVTIEHMHGLESPFVTSADINEAIKAVPDLKVTFDSGNCVTGGEPSDVAFRNSSDAIVHAHFKDWVISSNREGFDGSDGRYYTPVLIGEGVVDHEAVLREMVDRHYQGYINIEYHARVYDPKDAVIRAKRYLNSLMATIAAGA